MYQSDFLSALAEQGEIAPGYPDGYFPHWEHNVYGGAMPVDKELTLEPFDELKA